MFFFLIIIFLKKYLNVDFFNDINNVLNDFKVTNNICDYIKTLKTTYITAWNIILMCIHLLNILIFHNNSYIKFIVLIFNLFHEKMNGLNKNNTTELII